MAEQTPTSKQPPQSNAKPSATPPPANDSQIKGLIAALGTPTDPQHDQAEDLLIKFGTQSVSALGDVLTPQAPWLLAYRAANALGQIGDGRASRPLINVLSHPHANVRWSAVRALAKVGDSRAILALRRVAREDRGRTSWGESVAATAQAALNEMQRTSTLLRLSEPVKIALLVALAFFAFVWASGRVNAYRATLNNTSAQVWGTPVTPIIPTALPEEDGQGTDSGTDSGGEATPEATATPEVTVTPTVAAVTAQVVAASANVRPAPNTSNDPIGRLQSGQTVQILGQSGDWYKIQLPDATGTGWVSVSVMGPPSGPVPTLQN